jgi:hypothetical protein
MNRSDPHYAKSRASSDTESNRHQALQWPNVQTDDRERTTARFASVFKGRAVKPLMGLLTLLCASALVYADDLFWLGTWKQRSSPMTLVVERAGSGAKFTYHIAGGATTTLMAFETKFDGSYVPVFVDGKDSGELMMVKQIDARHFVGSWKMQGQDAGTSKSEISADGKSVKVENAISVSGGAPQTTVDYWDKQ